MSGIKSSLLDLGKSFEKFKQTAVKARTKQQIINEMADRYIKMGHRYEIAMSMAQTRYNEIHG